MKKILMLLALSCCFAFAEDETAKIIDVRVTTKYHPTCKDKVVIDLDDGEADKRYWVENTELSANQILSVALTAHSTNKKVTLLYSAGTDTHCNTPNYRPIESIKIID